MTNVLQPLLGNADLERPLCRARGQVITNGTFLADCHVLAQRLPEAGYVINTCADRYRFTVGLAAALLRRQVTLLPASLAPAQMLDLGQRYPGCYLLHDEAIATEGLDSFRYADAFALLGAAPSSPPAMPAFHPQQPAVVLFTSGSTGEPEPHPRNWGTLVASSRAAGRCLGLSALPGASILGTVPHQHSYGLESITMLALQFGLSFDPVRPLLPEDILSGLAQLPAPRILVTTPVHLRSLMHHAAAPPAVDCIVCATAPLAPALAQLAEDRFAAPLFEIYGCTEVGQIALCDAPSRPRPGLASRASRCASVMARSMQQDLPPQAIHP